MKPIYSTDRINKTSIYLYKGNQYKYLCKCPYSKSCNPQWLFEPLPNQRVKAQIKLNQSKIGRGYLMEVEI